MAGKDHSVEEEGGRQIGTTARGINLVIPRGGSPWVVLNRVLYHCGEGSVDVELAKQGLAIGCILFKFD